MTPRPTRHPTRAQVLARYKSAEAVKRQWQGLLADGYRYALPLVETGETDNQGRDRSAHLHDGTAQQAVADRAAILLDALFPAFQPWIAFEPSIAVPDHQQEAFRAHAQDAQAKLHAALMQSNFRKQVGLTLHEVQISTGCLAVYQGTPMKPLAFQAIPLPHLAPESAEDGRLHGAFRKRSLTKGAAKQLWPEDDVRWPADFEASDNDDWRQHRVTVLEAVLPHAWDRPETSYTVWLLSDEGATARTTVTDDAPPLVAREFRTNPWILAREHVAPGETLGRGRVLRAIADIRMLDAVARQTIQAAEWAVNPAYTADDDGVLVAEGMRIRPGLIVPKAVGSDGLVPIPIGGNLPYAESFHERLRVSVDQAIRGPRAVPLDPPDRRTATEVQTAVEERREVESPAAEGLVDELVAPLVRRMMDILTSDWARESPYYIEPFHIGEGEDEEVVRLVPVNPILLRREAARAGEVERAIASVVSFAQVAEPAARYVDMDALVQWRLKAADIPADLLMTDQKRRRKEADERHRQLARSAEGADALAVERLAQAGGG